jgi:hypothetical protein
LQPAPRLDGVFSDAKILIGLLVTAAVVLFQSFVYTCTPMSRIAIPCSMCSPWIMTKDEIIGIRVAEFQGTGLEKHRYENYLRETLGRRGQALVEAHVEQVCKQGAAFARSGQSSLTP